MAALQSKPSNFQYKKGKLVVTWVNSFKGIWLVTIVQLYFCSFANSIKNFSYPILFLKLSDEANFSKLSITSKQRYKDRCFVIKEI